MQRFTERIYDGTARLSFFRDGASATIEECIERLADYEDSGASPEEVRAKFDKEPIDPAMLKHMDGCPVFVVVKPDAAGDRLKFWALVSVNENTGDVDLTNNLGGTSPLEEVMDKIEGFFYTGCE